MVLQKLLRLGEGRKARQLWKIVEAVNALSDEMAALSDAELQAKTDAFRARLEDGETVEDLQVESFAVIREVAWRVLGQRPFDVQVFGGAAIHDGNIAEMKTGEGKTLTSTMPVYLNALSGEGVHVVTVNEYLAARDAQWMGDIHRFMGLDVGVIRSMQPRDQKKDAYRADITYGTTNEFGFDYLRDNMAMDAAHLVQRGHHFALLDEVDSILIDEARTPLIISGPAEQSAQLYQVFARQVVPNLSRGEDLGNGRSTGDYVVDEAKRTVGITEEGVAKVEGILNVDNLYEDERTPLVHHLQNALKAKELFKRDDEYIVVEGEVKIVDEQTGRVLDGRRYSEGLHQAIEAKEGVRIKEENQTLATITIQNYYRIYDKLAGMTGTAKTEEIEFDEIYELGVVVVPTNEPMIRDDRADLIYKTEKSKFESTVDDIEQRNEKGQPVLVGTTSVEKSERLSSMLKRRGVPHEVLNAKRHAREAHIVAQAGRRGAVTVATNMAGRGTDIMLGGNPEELAKDEVSKLPEETTEEEREQTHKAALARYTEQCRAEHEEVVDLGGLYVLGTERHESRRIDNQLRGRSGRQGDPGESRFYLSLEDDLLRLFNANAVEKIMDRLRIPEDVPIEHKWVTRAVSNAQQQVESRNFDIRKNVLKYDDVLNEQRKVIYQQREKLLSGDREDIGELAARYIEGAIGGAVDSYCPEGVFPEDWPLTDLAIHLQQLYPVSYDFDGIDLERIDRDELRESLIGDAFDRYEEREEEVGGEDLMREVERRIILSVVDRKWREHLYEMDALRDGIGLRAVGQRDPLVEYQREAYDSFQIMMDGIREEAVTYFFHLPVRRSGDDGDGQQAEARGAAAEGADADAGAEAADGGRARREQQLSYSSAGGGGMSYGAGGSAGDGSGGGGSGRDVSRTDEGRTVRQIAKGGTYTADEKIGRNDPCHCGSGKKYKKCHWPD